MSEHLADSLNRRYRAALALVAFLVLLNQLLVQPSLMRLTTDAPIINIAGRQRMLSQRLAKAALAMDRADAKARSRHLDELEQVLRLWSAVARWAAPRKSSDVAARPEQSSRERRARCPGAALSANANRGGAIDPKTSLAGSPPSQPRRLTSRSSSVPRPSIWNGWIR